MRVDKGRDVGDFVERPPRHGRLWFTTEAAGAPAKITQVPLRPRYNIIAQPGKTRRHLEGKLAWGNAEILRARRLGMATNAIRIEEMRKPRVIDDIHDVAIGHLRILNGFAAGIRADYRRGREIQ